MIGMQEIPEDRPEDARRLGCRRCHRMSQKMGMQEMPEDRPEDTRRLGCRRYQMINQKIPDDNFYFNLS